MRRSQERISAHTSSATAVALRPGQLATKMPRRLAAATSTWSVLVPATTIMARRGLASMASAVMPVVPVIRTSGPVSFTARARVDSESSGSFITVQPRPRSASSPLLASGSQTRTLAGPARLPADGPGVANAVMGEV